MNKVNRKVQPFFQVHPCGKVFTHDQQAWKARSRIFFGPFLSCATANNLVTAQVSGNFFKLPLKTRSKHNEFPKLLPRHLKVRQWRTAVQRSPSRGVYNRMAERVTVWEDKTCLYASRSLYSFSNHQRQLCAVADKKEVKLLKNWTSRLGVESAVCGVEVKEMPLFSQQHCRGIQVSATANLNVQLRGFYVSFRMRVNLWMCVFGYSLFVSPPAEKMVKMAKCREKQNAEMLKLTASGKDTARCVYRDYHCGISLY